MVQVGLNNEMSLARNYFYNTLLQVTNVLMPLVTAPYVARVLLSHGVGLAAFSLAQVQYFCLLAGLGINLYGSRTLAEVRDDEDRFSDRFWELFLLKSLTSALALVCYLGFVILTGVSPRNVFLWQSLYIVSVWLDTGYVFAAKEDFRWPVFCAITMRLLTLIPLFTLVRTPDDTVVYVAIGACAVIGSQLGLWLQARRMVRFRRPRLQNAGKHFFPMLKLFLPMVAIQIYTVLDRTILGWLASLDEVGYYENSQKLLKISLQLIVSVGVVMVPRISYLASRKDQLEIQRQAERVFDYITYASVLLLAGMAGLSDVFIPFYFGEAFRPAVAVTQLMCPIILFIGWSNFLGLQIMVPMKKESWFTLSVSAAAALNLGGNLLLIPRWGAKGAAMATVAAEASVVLIQLFFVHRLLKLLPLFRETWKHALAGVLTFLFFRRFPDVFAHQILDFLLRGTLGCVLYVMLEFVLRSQINRYIFQRLSQIVKNRLTRGGTTRENTR
ncbi:MAG: polysaccharide biosynthesis protein [Lentisphaerae bacterium]|nr:MAG: polysaccharide biosynthesis protein [Lentisphaerota bacterium]